MGGIWNYYSHNMLKWCTLYLITVYICSVLLYFWCLKRCFYVIWTFYLWKTEMYRCCLRYVHNFTIWRNNKYKAIQSLKLKMLIWFDLCKRYESLRIIRGRWEFSIELTWIILQCPMTKKFQALFFWRTKESVFVRYLQVLGIDTTSLLHNLLAIDGSPAPSPWD